MPSKTDGQPPPAHISPSDLQSQQADVEDSDHNSTSSSQFTAAKGQVPSHFSTTILRAGPDLRFPVSSHYLRLSLMLLGPNSSSPQCPIHRVMRLYSHWI